jgi:hypothetical protein
MTKLRKLCAGTFATIVVPFNLVWHFQAAEEKAQAALKQGFFPIR